MKTLYNTILIFSLMLLGYGVLENQRHNGILLGIAAKHEALHTQQSQINTLQNELNVKEVNAYLFQNKLNKAMLDAILLPRNDESKEFLMEF